MLGVGRPGRLVLSGQDGIFRSEAMQMVRFVKPWRGHALEAVADLTDARAAELMGQKYCVAYVVPAEPVTPVVQKSDTLLTPEMPEPRVKVVEPETVKPPRRRRQARE